MVTRRFWAQFDVILLGLALTLALLGALGVYSASLAGDSDLYWGQLTRLGVGLLICLLVMLIDYRQLVDAAVLLYLGALGILVLVLFFGTTINGSKSWITLPGFNFQPSELTKIVVILLLVKLFSDHNEDYLNRRQLTIVGVACAVPILLIILQHDLGTAVMFIPIVAVMLLVAGVRKKLVIGALAIALVAAPAVWFGLKDYQKQRVLVTLDPELDPLGVGYQTRQAQIAIGSGGLFGRGIGQGLQSQLGFVPYSHTDFIFALLAEDTGFVGASVILLLYSLLISRLITVGQQARDRAGMLIIAGVVAFVFSHVLVNVGMVLGIIPAIGIPLPLLSYGGSSTLSTFVALGLALSVALRRYMYA